MAGVEHEDLHLHPGCFVLAMHPGRGKARPSVVVCTKSVAAQSGQGNWKSKSLRLGKESLGDPSSEDEGWRKKIGKEKRSNLAFL